MSDSLGSLGAVSAVFDANTELFDKKVAASGEKATVSARAIAKAAKQQADAQAFSARFAADAITEQSLRIVAAQKAVSEVNKDYKQSISIAKKGYLEEADAAKLVAANLQRLTQAREQAALAAKIEGEATSHAAVSQQMAASAAVRGLEGNAGIRSVERFLITVPGVGAGLQTIFPLVGGGMFVSLLAKGGVELYNLEQKGKHAGEELDRAFGEMNQKLDVSNDKLALTNAKIEEQLAKLGGHPANGMQVALNEARVAADDLQESLAADLKSLEALLKEHNVGTFEGLLAGVSPTGGSNKEITDAARVVERQGKDSGAAYRKAMIAAGSDPAQQEAATKAYYGRMDQIAAGAASKMRQRATDIAAQQKEIEKRVSAPTKFDASGTHRIAGAEDLTPVRSSFEDAALMFDAMQQRAQLSAQNFADNAKLQVAQGSKELLGLSKKADEERLKQAEGNLALMRLNGNDSIKWQFDYWENMKSSFAARSDQYNAIVEKQLALAERGAARAHELIGKYKKDQESLSIQGDRASEAGKDALAGMRQYERTRQDTENERSMRDRMEQERVSGSLASERVGISEAATRENSGRGISKLDAAAQIAAEHQDLAAQHTKDFSDSLNELTGRMEYISARLGMQNLPSEESDRLQKEGGQLRAEIARLQEERAHQQMQDTQQSMQDAYAVHPGMSSAGVGVRDALDDFVSSTRDAAAAMHEITTNTLSAINGGILKDLTSRNRSDRKNVWTDVGKTVFTGVAGSALKKGEGMILDGIGFGSGKTPKGTAGDPLHVVFAGSLGSGSAMPGIIKNAVGGGSSSGFSGIMKVGASVLGLPGFALGGDVSGGTLAMVGERGPEPVLFGSSAHVYPNGTKFGGDTHSYTYHVDARGASDPAAVDLAVQRGIAAAAPHIVTQSYRFGQEMQRRQPSTKRG